MLNNFKAYINTKIHLSRNDTILLTVSGGADSVVMLDLFAQSGFKCGIAHCNFHLRGNDSDKDEALVKKLAEKYRFPYFKIDFDTKNYANRRGISVEMAARELRYEWFEKIRKENNYDYIATAHHADDVVETFFLNLLRGTGIRGLSGIKAVSGKIIRPLLFTGRDEIIDYIKSHHLSHREDATNNDTKFKRNKLRKDIIPQFGDINQAYKANILKTIAFLEDTNSVLQAKIKEISNHIVQKQNHKTLFDIEKILDLDKPSFYLFELLYPYGYNAAQVDDIVQALNGSSGKIFYSADYQIVKDRNFLILAPIDKNTGSQTVYLTENIKKIKLGENQLLKISFFKNSTDFKLPKDNKIAVLDKNKLKFPLIIRKWQRGDYFYPLGMKQKKKLSDFFIDMKLSYFDKQQVHVLLSGDDIVWIIAYRIDNRYKLTAETENIMQISTDFL
jgi:tRNA(Ile)-lysidine synthase